MPLSGGQILQGNYRIVRLLGQGGMGAVYLAEHTRLSGRLLAIKENTPEPFADQETQDQLREQFYTEARILAALDHPNLPKVTDYFSEGGVEYLVMDYVEGENLQQEFERYRQQHGKPLPEKLVVDWADQLLSALEYMHSRHPHPVIHRDIKPSNIILTPEGVVRLVDFGLVKLFSGYGQNTATAMRGMGTPDYTPLEQYPGSQSHTDARTDIYSLGATLYHLLTGSPPANVRDQLLGASTLIPLRQYNPGVSANTDKAILHSIEVRPDDRFQSAQQMRAALAGQGSSKMVGVTPARRPWPALLFGIFMLAFVLLAGAAMALNGRNETSTIAVVSTASSTPLSTTESLATDSLEPAGATSPASIVVTPTAVAAQETPVPDSTSTRALLATATALATDTATSTPEPSSTPTVTRPASTNTPRSVATETSQPTSPPPAPSGDYQVAPVLLGPGDSANAGGEQTFGWRWDGPSLRADERFDWRLLRGPSGENVIDARALTTPGLTYSLGNLPGGDYYWSVRIIQVGSNGEFVALRSPEAARRLLRISAPVQNPPPDTPAPPPPPTDTPAPPPTDTPSPPTSHSFLVVDNSQDPSATGAGGALGVGLFAMLVVMSTWKQRRRR